MILLPLAYMDHFLQIAHNVSAFNRKLIITRAEQISVRVINAHARLRAEEAE